MNKKYKFFNQCKSVFNAKVIALSCFAFSWLSIWAFPGGSYTINSGATASATNYVSFTAFANDLKNLTRGDGGPANYATGGNGVQGPIVVDVAAGGTYTQQVKFNQILGVNATNTVTINGNGSILQFTATVTTDGATIDMDGTDYFRFINLEVRANGTYGHCFWLKNAANNNIIKKCKLKVPNGTTLTYCSYIWMSNGTTSPSTYANSGNFNLIDSNDMRSASGNGPYYAIVIVGPSAYSATNANNSNTISNNNIQDFYLYGVYCYYTSGTTITRNNIHNTGATRFTTKYGLYLYYTTMIADENRIFNLNGNTPQGSIMYPIYCYNYDNGTTLTNSKFRNNLIHAFSTTSLYSYFYWYASVNTGATLDIENNTFAYAYNTAVTNTGTMYGLYGSYWRNVENNIVYNNHGGTGTKYLHYDNGGCAGYTNFKNNNFDFGPLAAANTIGLSYGGSGCAARFDLAAMISAGLPTSNISVDPDFIDLSALGSNLTPTSIGMANKGKTVTGITTDINGVTRSSTPDIGALEYSVDLQVTSLNITFPSPTCSGYTTSIGATIKNNSAYPLKNPTIAYRVNTNAKVDYTIPNTTIASGASLTFTFPGTYKFSATGATKVSAFVTTPDDFVANDSQSLSTIVIPAPGGSNLTQNVGLSSPFASFVITGKPDITFPNEKLVYDFTAPSRLGYTNGDFGTKWFGSVSAKTVNGYNASGTVTASISAPFTVTLDPAKAWEDSTIVISVRMLNLLTGCDTIYTRKVLIAPKAVPGVKLPSVFCENAEIYFENLSTVSSGSIEYEWDFGDLSPIATEANPIHIFEKFGTYVVTMKAITRPYNFVSTKVFNVYITEVPEAKIINTNACQGNVVKLANGTVYSGGGVPVYTWDYGDGSAINTTTSLATINKIYSTPGGYKVTLTATADGCSDAVTKFAYQFARPVAAFVKVTGSCLNSEFKFLNNSTIQQGYFGNVWTYDDQGNQSRETDAEYTFVTAGVKNIKLRVMSEFGCRDSITQPFVVKQTPTTDFTYPFACSRTATPFSNTTNLNGESLQSYTWDFGDGTTSNAFSPVKNWFTVGPKNVKLKTSLSNGCSTEITKVLNVGVQPNVDFEALDGCAGTEVPFTNNTTFVNGEITYTWSFGDGKTTDVPAPIHAYASGVSQVYTVKLRADIAGGCSDSLSKSITIFPLPGTCNFDADRDYTTSLTNYKFTPTGGASTGINYTWLMGDGNQLSSSQGGVNYSFAGRNKYCITMIARNQAGCECATTKCINLATDIASAEIMNNNLSVYPNPNNGLFNVTFDAQVSEMTVYVYNTIGELVNTVTVDSNTANIDLSAMASGVYVVKVVTGNQVATKKITVTK
ncbi:MAG: PKD domain-containing protein [Bacteroidota bacterium]